MIEHIKYDWISGEGAIMLLLPKNASHLWRGTVPSQDGTILNTRFRLPGETVTGTDYDRAVDTYEYIKGSTKPYLVQPLQIGNETGVVIHDDYATAAVASDSGILFLRLTFGEDEELELVEEVAKTSQNWQRAFDIAIHSDTFYLIDPALAMEKIKESERLEVKLESGDYTLYDLCESRNGLEIIAHKLTRI
jgi:hypothetical protein